MKALSAHHQCSRRFQHALVFGILFAFICLNRLANDLECVSFKLSPVGDRRLTEESLLMDHDDTPRDFLATWNVVEKFHKEASESREPPTRVPYHPVFWHHPKSGGTTLETLMASCLRLVTASSHDGGNSTELKILNWNNVGRFVNVDLSTVSGMDRAVQLGFPRHLNMSDVLVSMRLHTLITKLLSPEENGLIFTLFRHPVERAVSMFYYLKVANWETTFKPEWQNLTLKEHILGGKVEKNWMTKLLLGDEYKKVNNESIPLAKELLRKHFVIGLTDQAEESIRRIARVFAWDLESHRSCFDGLMKHPRNVNKHQSIDPSSEEWQMLERMNSIDMELYNYAVELFHEQGDKWFGSGGLLALPDGEQNRNKKVPHHATSRPSLDAEGDSNVDGNETTRAGAVNKVEARDNSGKERGGKDPNHANSRPAANVQGESESGGNNVTPTKAVNKVEGQDDSGESGEDDPHYATSRPSADAEGVSESDGNETTPMRIRDDQRLMDKEGSNGEKEDTKEIVGQQGSKSVPGNESMGRSDPSSMPVKDVADAIDIEDEARFILFARVETWVSLGILIFLTSLLTAIRRQGLRSTFCASTMDTARAAITQNPKRRFQRPCATWRGQP